MDEKEFVRSLSTEIDQHPARLVWDQITGGGHTPKSIEILHQHKKSEIYRLIGCAPDESTVIAKRCLNKAGKLERIIYENILPLLPISNLRYYGSLEQCESDTWLFVEDAGDIVFSPNLDAHKFLAGKWLGGLHRSALQTKASELLPKRDAGYYFSLLQKGRDNIVQNLNNPALTPEFIEILKNVLDQIQTIESRWEDLLKFSKDYPETMVHGDFQPKNIRVKQCESGNCLYVMDWEKSGWGIPIVDLAPSHGMPSSTEVDLPAYLGEVQEIWKGVDIPLLEFAQHLGLIYRRLAAIYWSSKELQYEWLERPVLSMEIYHRELNQALDEVLGQG